MKSKSLQKITDATWELDDILEQWFAHFYPELDEEIRNKIMVRIINYTFLLTIPVTKEKK